jgi:hypothetical protein
LTVFELAEQASLGARHLEAYPDLLLYQFLPVRERGAAGPEAILVCQRGIVVGSKLFTERPRKVDRSNAALAQRLEAWFDFFFGDWARLIRDKPTPSSSLAGKLRLPEARVCPQCGQRFLASAGEKGIALPGLAGLP